MYPSEERISHIAASLWRHLYHSQRELERFGEAELRTVLPVLFAMYHCAAGAVMRLSPEELDALQREFEDNVENLAEEEFITRPQAAEMRSLTARTAEENRIHVVPLRIRCADGEYRDGVDIHAADIYARLKRGELPKTSLPTGEDIAAAFDRIAAEGYDGVIAVMLSGGLSGTYNLVRLMAEERKDLEIKVYEAGAPAHPGHHALLLGGHAGVPPEGWAHRQGGGHGGHHASDQAPHHLCPRRPASVHRQGPGPQAGQGQAGGFGSEGLRQP